jgi:hypothetical protein
MAWPVRGIEQDRETIMAIEAHDDRAAATLAGAYLEDRLESTIRAHYECTLRPKATFKEKINTAYQKGIIEEKVRDVLNAVRTIRNEFVHSLDPLTFNTPSVVKLCIGLWDVNFFRGFKEANAEMFNDDPIPVELASFFDPMLNSPNTPRNAYMNTIKTLLLIMELKKASVLMREGDFLEIRRGKPP